MPKTLAVPYIQQPNETFCGVCAMAMIVAFKLGDATHASSLVQAAITQSNQQFGSGIDTSIGITPNTIGDVFALRDVHTARYTYPDAALSFSTIKTAIDGNSPILVYIQDGLHGAYGHYVVIIGYGTDTNTHRDYIELHDPAGDQGKLVWFDLFPGSYYTQGNWIWGESWIPSWIS